MSEDFKNKLDSYIKAGKAVVAAKKLARTLVKPGVLFLDIADKCEAEILNNENRFVPQFVHLYSPHFFGKILRK